LPRMNFTGRSITGRAGEIVDPHRSPGLDAGRFPDLQLCGVSRPATQNVTLRLLLERCLTGRNFGIHSDVVSVVLSFPIRISLSP
jgi:hypothetical protein